MSDEHSQNIPIHFILLGHSKNHILAAIAHFKINKMVIFTSKELLEENLPFIQEIIPKSVQVLEVVELDPFEPQALENILLIISEKYRKYSGKGKIPIIISLTGGTNLMVVAMALVASEKRLKTHYVLNNESSDVIEIDYFERMKGKGSFEKSGVLPTEIS